MILGNPVKATGRKAAKPLNAPVIHKRSPALKAALDVAEANRVAKEKTVDAIIGHMQGKETAGAIAATRVALCKMSQEELDAELKSWQEPAAPVRTQPTYEQWQLMSANVQAEYLAEGFVDPTPAPAPAPALVLLPPPAPAPVIPKDVPPPAKIELVREGTTGKRYESKTAPDSKYHLRDRSLAVKPVTVVRNIVDANPGMERKDIIALCLAAGVNKNTAATQYSLYKAAKAKAAAAAAAALAGQPVDDEEGGEE